MLTETSFHRRGKAQGLMNAPKVMVHVKQRNHRNVIVQLLAERIRQASKATHLHPHIQILPFNVASRDVLLFRVADDFHAFGSQTLRGAVSGLSLGIVAINLVKLSEVDLMTEGIRDGAQVHPMAIRGQLDMVNEPRCQVPHEHFGVNPTAFADEPCGNKFGVRADGGPGPHVAVAEFVAMILRDVLLLRVAPCRPRL